MKSSRVFWQHLVLWTGAVVALSLLARIIPGYATTWLGMREFYLPYTAALLERVAATLAIAALPAGIAASPHLLSWHGSAVERIRGFTASAFAAAVLVFLLAGFGAPYAANTEEPSPTARLTANPHYYSFTELLPASARFHEQAHLGSRPGDAQQYNPVARERSETLKQRFFFILAWAITPLMLGWIGVLIRFWSSLLPRPQAVLAEWVAVLLLLVGVQLASTGTFGWYLARYGASPMMYPGTGRSILLVPAFTLAALAWTTALARHHVRATQ